MLENSVSEEEVRRQRLSLLESSLERPPSDGDARRRWTLLGGVFSRRFPKNRAVSSASRLPRIRCGVTPIALVYVSP